MIVLIVSIILLLILAGITISQLTGNGIFDKVKEAKEKYEITKQEEENILNQYSNSMDLEISNRLNSPRYKQLWSGTANQTGNKDSNGNEYSFGTDDISNYDFIIIQYKQIDNTNLCSEFYSINDINKDVTKNIMLTAHSSYSVLMHFTNNGFVVDELRDGVKEYIRSIYGIKF